VWRFGFDTRGSVSLLSLLVMQSLLQIRPLPPARRVSRLSPSFSLEPAPRISFHTLMSFSLRYGEGVSLACVGNPCLRAGSLLVKSTLSLQNKCSKVKPGFTVKQHEPLSQSRSNLFKLLKWGFGDPVLDIGLEVQPRSESLKELLASHQSLVRSLLLVTWPHISLLLLKPKIYFNNHNPPPPQLYAKSI
jgi:hypothetical protein